jgi:hypothetical protein
MNRALTKQQFLAALRESADFLDSARPVSTDEYLNVARLWNTLMFYQDLQRTPEGTRFDEVFRRRALPDMAQALNMEVSRGFAYYSKELDFVVGGPPDERFRFDIPDPD